MRFSACLVIAVPLLWASAVLAQGEKPKTTEQRFQELSTRIDEAMRAAADSAAALKALQELQRQIIELQKDSEGQQAVARGYQEARRALDRLESRLGGTELRLDALRIGGGERGVAGYDQGFYLRSGVQRPAFLLRANGLLQAAYDGVIWGGARLPADPVLGEAQSTFLLRRAALAFSGHVVFDSFTYRLELNFGSEDPGPLLEGWLDLGIPEDCCLAALRRWVGLRVGQQKIPVGRQMQVHSSGLEFVDRSGPTLAFAPGWDLGAVLHGEIPPARLSYQLGIFNGGGARMPENDNIDFLYAVRLLAEPFGPLAEPEGEPEPERWHGGSPFRLALGGSFAYNLAPTDLPLRKGTTDAAAASKSDADHDGNIDNVAVYTVGAELAARFAGASLESELFYRREDPGLVGGDEQLFGSGWGVYAQLGYFLPFHRGTNLAARYSYWEPTRYGESRVTYLADRLHEVAAVVNMHLTRFEQKDVLKLQLEYAHQWQRGIHAGPQALDGGAEVNLVRLQLQVAF